MDFSVRILGRKEIAQSSGVMCLVKGLVLKLRLELGKCNGTLVAPLGLQGLVRGRFQKVRGPTGHKL